MKKQLLLALCFLPCGCESLRTFQANPTTQFIEGQAVKLLASYYGNGGKVDVGWGITQGLNQLADFGTFRDLAKKDIPAQDTIKQQIKAFSGDPVAVNGLAESLSMLVSPGGTPDEKAAGTLALAKGVQTATAKANFSWSSPGTWF